MRPGPAPDNRAMPAPASTLDPAIDAAPNQPRSKTDLFMSFTWLALQGFGGVLAVVQRELVEKKRWMTREQFVEDWAVAQIMPGPNVVNLSLMIGGRYFGLAGALAGVAGMLTAPLVVVLLLAIGHRRAGFWGSLAALVSWWWPLTIGAGHFSLYGLWGWRRFFSCSKNYKVIFQYPVRNAGAIQNLNQYGFKWGIGYIDNRYQSPCGALAHSNEHNWY